MASFLFLCWCSYTCSAIKVLYCHMQIDLQTVCKHFIKINIWMLELLRYSFVNQINIQLIKCSCCISCDIDLYKVWCTLGKTKCCQNFFSCRMSNLLSPSNTRTRKWVKSFFVKFCPVDRKTWSILFCLSLQQNCKIWC